MAAAEAVDATARLGGPSPAREILRQPDARLAIVALVCGQAVMVMLMVITSVSHSTVRSRSARSSSTLPNSSSAWRSAALATAWVTAERW